jgi:anti-sigma regulatory factor (Ser/Thr protein kinase)
VLDKDGKIIQRLTPTGPVVGIFPEARFKVEQVDLKKGDFLIAFTDGTLDAQNSAGASFSEERLLKYVQAPWTSLFSMMYELKTELQNYENGQNQFDDITLLSIRRRISPNSEQHAICRAAEMKNLGEIKAFTTAVAEKWGLSQANVLSFSTVVEEACSNIIQHGYEGTKNGFLSLFFDDEPDKARFIVRDNGRHLVETGSGITRSAVDAPGDDADRLGISSMKEYVDTISYSRMEGRGNQLVVEVVKNPRFHRRGKFSEPWSQSKAHRPAKRPVAKQAVSR